MAKNTGASLAIYTLPFGGEGIALRAKLSEAQKGVLKQARENGAYFAWDATARAYTCVNGPGMLAFATALVDAINASIPDATPAAPAKPRVNNALDLIASIA